MSSIISGQSTANTLPRLASNGWPVAYAPLADRRQGYGCRATRVYVVDTEVPATLVPAVLDQLVAATEGRWSDAPHATRPAPSLVHSTALPAQRSGSSRPVLTVVR